MSLQLLTVAELIVTRLEDESTTEQSIDSIYEEFVNSVKIEAGKNWM